MYYLRAQINNDHHGTDACFDESLELIYDNPVDAHNARRYAAEEHAMKWHCDVNHDDTLGDSSYSVSTFDDGQYTLFEVRRNK